MAGRIKGIGYLVSNMKNDTSRNLYVEYGGTSETGLIITIAFEILVLRWEQILDGCCLPNKRGIALPN
ncbi:MAG: hypothetical protein PF692_00865 [Kiritimatiellae bacterium]|jgi:hypothetical protein|nr:hypothetical protein [Kiritimatiellia bacterium]